MLRGDAKTVMQVLTPICDSFAACRVALRRLTPHRTTTQLPALPTHTNEVLCASINLHTFYAFLEANSWHHAHHTPRLHRPLI